MGAIECGSQVVLCEYPIRFDTYRGCTHDCKYCFARCKTNIEKVEPLPTNMLKPFIGGKRSQTTNWCDWNIPLHWGGMSDPFQPAEKTYKKSLEALQIFAQTKYPFIVSTKGRLIATQPYLDLLAACKCVVQISMTSPLLDALEKGAPTFNERLEMIEKIAPHVLRVIVRAQPYMPECKETLINALPAIKSAGAYGITLEGMKFKKRKPTLVKCGGDYAYPESRLKSDYLQIREKCHEVGLAFFCAENRLRYLGESTACCGCGDLEGFKGNTFNCVSLQNGADAQPTQRMKEKGTASCFKGIYQHAGSSRILSNMNFSNCMLSELKKQKDNATYNG